MFERNKIDNGAGAAQQQAVAAEITLGTGDVLAGHFLISAARTLADLLNGETQFLEFEPFDAPRRYIAKTTIAAVKLMDAPHASALDARRPVAGAFDPYSALGVRRDCCWDDVRSAYLRLAKTYHADRFASVDLPGEVREYLQQMSRRVNAAYTALEAPRLMVRKSEQRPEPVFTSRPRA